MRKRVLKNMLVPADGIPRPSKGPKWERHDLDQLGLYPGQNQLWLVIAAFDCKLTETVCSPWPSPGYPLLPVLDMI